MAGHLRWMLKCIERSDYVEAKIEILRNSENDYIVYPQTHVQAIYDNENNRLDNILKTLKPVGVMHMDSKMEVFPASPVLDADKLNGKFPEYYATNESVMSVTEKISNSNILINSDFRINQRGLSTYTRLSTDRMYTVDRWEIGMNDMVSVSDASIIYTPGNGNFFRQAIYNYSDYKGKTLTLSVELQNITGGSFKLTLDDGVNKYETVTTNAGVYTTTGSISENASHIWVYISGDAGQSVNVKWAKLEMGNAFTKFVSPERMNEIEKCRYFYREIDFNKRIDYYTENSVIAVINDIYMRTYPTLKFKNSDFNTNTGTSVKNSNGGALYNGFTFSITPRNDYHSFEVVGTRENHGLKYDVCIGVRSANPICLDAEIY